MPTAPMFWHAVTVWPTLTETVDMCDDIEEEPSACLIAT